MWVAPTCDNKELIKKHATFRRTKLSYLKQASYRRRNNLDRDWLSNRHRDELYGQLIPSDRRYFWISSFYLYWIPDNAVD